MFPTIIQCLFCYLQSITAAKRAHRHGLANLSANPTSAYVMLAREPLSGRGLPGLRPTCHNDGVSCNSTFKGVWRTHRLGVEVIFAFLVIYTYPWEPAATPQMLRPKFGREGESTTNYNGPNARKKWTRSGLRHLIKVKRPLDAQRHCSASIGPIYPDDQIDSSHQLLISTLRPNDAPAYHLRHLLRLESYRNYHARHREQCRAKGRERMARLRAKKTEEQRVRHREAQARYRERFREEIAHRARRANVKKNAAVGKETKLRPKARQYWSADELDSGSEESGDDDW
ncbi:hypothetical protein B0H12DRAFT_1072780 [Mycena haematopus]|nr:hypothetical protein B0H12DRAFT_1072780 [Mycena haematopus]